MHRYIGLDVHKQSCVGVVIGPSGRRLREQRMETNGKVIREFVSSVAGTRHLCFKEGTQPPHARDRATQKARSSGLSRGRIWLRAYVATCWQRERFSKAREAREAA